jgi:hypothetical protein
MAVAMLLDSLAQNGLFWAALSGYAAFCGFSDAPQRALIGRQSCCGMGQGCHAAVTSSGVLALWEEYCDS